MINQATSILLISLAALSSAAAVPDDFRGLTGREITAKIRLTRPTALVTSTLGASGAWAITGRYAVRDDGSLTDFYSDSRDYRLGNVAVEPPQGIELLPVAPAAWWGGVYGDSIVRDLVNLVPADFDVIAHKRDYPPGKVEEALCDNGFWRSGIATIASTETNVFEPADCYKGDFARIFMYMAAVWPMSFWQSYGPMIYLDGDWPLLNLYSRRLLLAWHRDDPVDDFERQRDRVISEAQGCGNPFVSMPELVEYVWGDSVGQPYTPPSESEEPRLPLKAVYSIAADRVLTLYSPYIASDVTWTVDGKTVGEESISLSDLGTGRHIIAYSNRRLRGTLIIHVRP